MRDRAFGVLRIGLVVAGLLAVPVSADATGSCSGVSNATDLTSAFAAGGTVTLCNDITDTDGLVVGSGASGDATSVTLDLNDHTLSVSAPNTSDAAVQVPSGASLTVNGPGTLDADAETIQSWGAGIGGDGSNEANGGAGGKVTITGGTVTASSYYGPGIGGGSSLGAIGGTGGKLTITGGTVTATSENGAGIGGGVSGDGPGSAGGEVTITGGTVTTTGANGGAGIGGSYDFSGGLGESAAGGAGGEVTISGGTVTATGALGAGIGGGLGYGTGPGGAGGKVTITGGTVTATGEGGAAGIGGGDDISDTGGEGGDGGDLRIGTKATVMVAAVAESPYPAGAAIGGGATVDVSYSVSGYGAFGSLSNAGTLDVESGSLFGIPPGTSVDNSGLLGGDGAILNDGAIVLSGGGSVAGGGTGNGTTGLEVGQNNYLLTLDADGGSGAPSSLRVFAPTVAGSGETLPVPLRKGWSLNGWFTAASGGSQVTDTTTLSGDQTLYAQWTLAPSITATVSSRVKRDRFGWYRTPVTIHYTCKPPAGAKLSGACPAKVVVTRNGSDTISRTVRAANGGYATSTTVVDLDRSKPSIRVTGVRDHRTYAHARKLGCVAHAVSGIRSCRIHRQTATAGTLVTVDYTAIAVSRADNRRTITGWYRIRR